MDARALRLPAMATHRRRRTRAAVAVAVVVATVALVAAQFADASDAAQQRVDRMAVALTTALDASVDDATSTLTTARGLFVNDREPTPADFRAFFAATAPAPATGDRRLPDMTFVRRSDDARRYVVALGTDPSEPLLDIDVGASATHRAAADAARDSGGPALTGWVAPLALADTGAARIDRVTTVYLPVYRTGRVPSTTAARRAALVGWTSTRIDAPTLFAAADVAPTAGDDVTLYAGTPSADTFVHTARTDAAVTGPRLRATRTVTVGSREWTVVVTGPDSSALVATPLSGFLLVLALVLATIVGTRLVTHGSNRGTDRAHHEPGASHHTQPATTPTDQPGKASAPATDASDKDMARVSRELRVPLNGMLGLATLMLYDELNAEQRERLLTLQQSGHHLLAILDGVCDNQARTDRYAMAPFRLTAVIDHVVAAYTPAAVDKDLSLRRHVDPGLGLLLGDASQLRRVLQHLVANALAYTDRGSVDVIAELVDRTDAHITIRLAVHDTGVGMQPDVQRRLRAPFDADDEPVSWDHREQGIGLAICRQIVGRMGGTVEVLSTHEQGTTISCTIDLRGVGHNAEPDRVSGTAPPSTPRMESAASPVAILLAEDDDINQVVAQGMLEQLGYAVDIASDGIEAVDSLRRRSYDLVLMDCGMPRLDGFATTAHIRTMEGAARHTPIIAMTAATLDSDRQRCVAVGMDDYLSKPVTIDALADALRRAGLAPAGAPGQ